MANLKEIKNRITSVTSTQQITKAMKMVAAAKLRKSQDRIIQLRPYSQKLSEVLQNVSATLGSDAQNPYAEEREVKNVLIIAVTSDRGLCGGFNSNINKAVIAVIEEKYKDLYASGNIDFMPIGSKAHDFFRKRKDSMIEGYSDLFTRLTFENVREAAEIAMNGFLSKKYDRVEIIYNEFKNVATQIVCTEQFLPIEKKELEKGKSKQDFDYIFEPEKEEIINLIIPKTLKTSFYKAVLESNASEHGARMTAMDKATDNAGELLKELKLTYNRTRQAAITTEILEIVGGAEALAQGS